MRQKNVFLKVFVVMSMFLSCNVLPAPVLAIAPTDKSMILLKCSGTMAGPVEVSFAPHSFSILNNNGLVIWRDKAPDKLELLNTENHTVLTVTIAEYVDDLSSGLKSLDQATVSKPVPVTLSDGRKATQIEFTSMKRRRNYTLRSVFVSDVTLPAPMLRAWCSLFFIEPGYGLPVTVMHNHPKTRAERVSARPEIWRVMINFKSLKAVPMLSERFTIPKDFKRAKDKSALYFSEDGVLKKEDIDDLFRSEKSR